MSCTHNGDIGAILADCANETLAAGADPFSCAIAEVSVALATCRRVPELMPSVNVCDLLLTLHLVRGNRCIFDLPLTVHLVRGTSLLIITTHPCISFIFR